MLNQNKEMFVIIDVNIMLTILNIVLQLAQKIININILEIENNVFRIVHK